jgi:hypothetical protein
MSMHVGRFEGDTDGAGYQGKSAGTRQFPEVVFKSVLSETVRVAVTQ